MNTIFEKQRKSRGVFWATEGKGWIGRASKGRPYGIPRALQAIVSPVGATFGRPHNKKKPAGEAARLFGILAFPGNNDCFPLDAVV